MAKTFTAVVKFTSANALPENTFLRTTKPALVLGIEITPLAIPAFKRAATRGANDLPE